MPPGGGVWSDKRASAVGKRRKWGLEMKIERISKVELGMVCHGRRKGRCIWMRRGGSKTKSKHEDYSFRMRVRRVVIVMDRFIRGWRGMGMGMVRRRAFGGGLRGS
jgi:hypothetical protein